jgi:hypothetical protein
MNNLKLTKMKKITTIIFSLLSLYTFAQHGKADFEESTYFNLGWAFPDMDHVKLYNPQNKTVNTIAGEMELGGVWCFRQVKITKAARLGLTGDFLNLGCNYVTFTEAGSSSKSKIITGRWSINLGPNIAIRLYEQTYIDLYAKGRLTFCYDHIQTLAIPKGDEGVGIGFRYSGGLNFRWKVLYIGGEYVVGKTSKVVYQNFTADVTDNFFKLKLGVNI